MSELGARLYEIVEEYAAIGAHHRTGTAEDARTLDWFENRVRALGAKSERQPWSFDRYDAEWSVTVDGADVAALPLFYEGTGEVESTPPLVAEVSAVPAGTFPQWATIVADARSAGAPVAVVATRSRSARPESWVGEARVWCTLDRPLISMAGGFPLFHTPEDVPERATTPALLDRVYHAAVSAARIIARST